MSTTYVGSAQPPAAQAVRRLTVLSWVVIAALALDALLSVAGIASDVSEHNLVRQALTGTFAPDILSKAQAADDRAHTIAVTEIALYVVTAILFIAWFHQAYKNVARLGVAGMRWSSGWAIGSWFVPILNLIRPKQIMNDIWRGSDPDLRIGSTLSLYDPPLLYQVWWGMWIAGWVVDRLAFTNYDNAETLSQLSTATVWLAVSDALDLIGAALAIAVVYSLTSRQRKRAEAVAALDPTAA
jgi:hypothetical protein